MSTRVKTGFNSKFHNILVANLYATNKNDHEPKKVFYKQLYSNNWKMKK